MMSGKDKGYIGDEQLDMLFRNGLADAGEDVPAGVWEAVSAKLDAAGNGSKTVPFLVVRRKAWRYVAAGLGVAAVLAGGLFVTGNINTESSDVPEVVAEVVIEEPADSEGVNVDGKGIDAVADADSGVTGKSEYIAEVRSESQTTRQPVAEYESGVMTENLITSDTESDDSIGDVHGNVGISDAGAPAGSVSETNALAGAIPEDTSGAVAGTVSEAATGNSAGAQDADSQDDSDVWNRIERENEDAEDASGFSLSLGGLMQTNNNAQGLSVRRNLIGAIKPPTKTTIRQTSKESTYSVPVSFGLGLTYAINKHISVGTGLNYSFMQRTFTGTYTKVVDGEVKLKAAADIHNTLHYVGIPIKVYYHVIPQKRIDFYAYGGAQVEKGVRNVYELKAGGHDIHERESIKGVQTSVEAGLGISFRIVQGFSLYADPSLRYYFDCNQPVSIRTQQPLMLNLELGLRFEL